MTLNVNDSIPSKDVVDSLHEIWGTADGLREEARRARYNGITLLANCLDTAADKLDHLTARVAELGYRAAIDRLNKLLDESRSGETERRLRTALERYARREHFWLSNRALWDVGDEESPNFLCGTGSAHIEDGTWAREALAGAAEGKP